MSNCACIYVGDDERYRTIKDTYRTARKEHTCDECGRTIEPGEKYDYFLGVLSTSKKPDTWKTCKDCVSVRDEFFCDGWSYGMMWEDVGYHVSETYGEISSSCLLSLTPRAREMVLDIIDEVFEEINEDEEDEDEHESGDSTEH